MEYKSNAQDCLHEIFNYMYGEHAYVADTCGGNQGNEIMVEWIKRDYKPMPYVRKDKKKEAWKKLINAYGKWWTNQC